MSTISNRSVAESEHPLLHRVQVVARRAKQLMFARAVAWVVTLSALALLTVALFDWLTRTNSRSLRWGLSGLLLATICLSLWRLVIPLARMRLALVSVATKIEQCFPILGDQLSSSVSFLTTPGTDGLRQTTIAHTVKQCEGLNLAEVIDPWPTIRAVTFSVVSLSLFGGLLWMHPDDASHAAARVTQPWRPLAWPRQDHLRMDQLPSTVHYGANLDIVVRNETGDVPEDTVLVCRNPDGEQQKRLRQSGHAGTARIPNIRHPIELRARGGDDDTMSWHRIDVVHPPLMKEHRWELKPPSYLEQPQRTIEAFRFDVIEGTTGSVVVQFDRPIAQAILIRQQDSRTWKGAIQDSELTAKFENLTLDQSTTLNLQFTDTRSIDGESNREWKINVTNDIAPILTWKARPTENIATAGARISLIWHATDDHGLRRTGVTCRVNGDASTERVLIDQAVELPLTYEQRTDIDLSDHEVEIGDLVEFIAWAVDTKGQRSETEPHKVSIVNGDAIRDHAAAVEQTLLDSIRETIAEQRASRDLTRRAENDALANATSSDAKQHLQNALDRQKSVQNRLSDDAELMETASGVLQSLGSNGLADDDTTRLQRVVSQLESVGEFDVPEIVDQLQASNRNMQSGHTSDLSDRLSQIGELQNDVADRLESIAEGLSQRDTVRDLSRQLAQLEEDQQNLSRDTSAGEQQLTNLADRQNEISRRASRISDAMRRAQDRLESSSPEMVRRVKEAGERMVKGELIRQMRQAAEDLAQERPNRAADRQEAIQRTMRDVRDALEGRERSQLDASAAALEQTGKELQELSERQNQLSSDLANRNRSDDELNQQWDASIEEASRLAEQAQGMGLSAVANHLEQTRGHQNTGRQATESGNMSAAAEASRNAQNEIDAAIESVQRRRREIAEQQQRETLWKLIESVEAIARDQRMIADELADQSNQLLDLVTLTARERELAEKLSGLQPIAKPMVGIGLAIETAHRDVRKVAASLARGIRSDDTVAAASAAARRLEYVAEALVDMARSEPSPQSRDEDLREDQTDQQPNAQVSQATLRLLIGLQQWLMDRTRAIEEQDPSDGRERSAQSLRVIHELADEQRQLHKEFQKIKQAIETAEEPNP